MYTIMIIANKRDCLRKLSSMYLKYFQISTSILRYIKKPQGLTITKGSLNSKGLLTSVLHMQCTAVSKCIKRIAYYEVLFKMCNRKIDCPSNYFIFIDVIDVKLLSNNYRSCNCQYPVDITYKRPVFMSATGSTT